MSDQPSFLLHGESAPLDAFKAFMQRRPDVMQKLLLADFDLIAGFKVQCDIHTVYGLATELYDLQCDRTWLPDFAHQIEADTGRRFKHSSGRNTVSAPRIPSLASLPLIEAYKMLIQHRPEVKPKLICAARDLRDAFGVECDIHTAYGLAMERDGLKCGRSWLPAFVRDIEAETELRFSKRTSVFDGMEPLL
jgi:hypothetical protein